MNMNARIALSISLAVFGACATDDADTNTDTDVGADSRVTASVQTPIFDQIGETECGNGVIALPAVQQIELRWLATSCDGPNELSLAIKGVEVLKTAAGAGCTCMPGVRSVTISDRNTLALIGHRTDFEVSAPGATLLAWAELAITDSNGEHVVTLFDVNGPSSSPEAAENLCLAGSTENGSGSVEIWRGEQCDDGNLVDGDGCSSTCQKE
jgi:cysteine-rich repeat protein